MYMELFVEGKKTKIWQLGLSEIGFTKHRIDKREKELKMLALTCKIDADYLILNKSFEMYAIIPSKMNTMEFTQKEIETFNQLIEKK